MYARLLCHRLEMPDVPDILFDRSVGRELSGARGIHQRHFRPAHAVVVRFLHPLLRLGVGAEIREDEVLVRTAEHIGEQRVIEILEHPRVGVEGSVNHLREHLTDLRVVVENVIRVVALAEKTYTGVAVPRHAPPLGLSSSAVCNK